MLYSKTNGILGVAYFLPKNPSNTWDFGTQIISQQKGGFTTIFGGEKTYMCIYIYIIYSNISYAVVKAPKGHHLHAQGS